MSGPRDGRNFPSFSLLLLWFGVDDIDYYRGRKRKSIPEEKYLSSKVDWNLSAKRLST